jgi:hypothetical protein
MGYFTGEQLQDFKRDGFVIVRGMYAPAEMEQLSRWIDALAAKEPEHGKEMVYYEDHRQLQGTRVLGNSSKTIA